MFGRPSITGLNGIPKFSEMGLRKRENLSRTRLVGVAKKQFTLMDEKRLIHELLIGLFRRQYKADLHLESDLHQVPEE